MKMKMLMAGKRLRIFCLVIVTILVSIHQVQSQQLRLRGQPEQRTLLSYQTCKSNDDCKENSVCHNSNEATQGLCKCLDEYLIIRNRKTYNCVLPAKSIDSDCIYDEQCEYTLGIGSECDANHKCRCMPDSHYVKIQNSCYRTAHLNETCVEHLNCLPNVQGDQVFCTNGKCTCGLKQYPNANGKCVVVRRLGEQCDNDDYCLSMNAVCRIVCVCRTGYVIEEDERFCLKAALNLFDLCTQHSQCETYIKNSECVRGRCQCKSEYQAYGNNCYQPRPIGSLCKSKGDCVTALGMEERVDCINAICTCNQGLDPDTCSDTSSATLRLTDSILRTRIIIAVFCSIIAFLLID